MHNPPPKRLILLACTATKRADPDPLPAIQRYDGPSFRTLRKWQAANPAAAEHLDVRILSAKLGLIAADAPISDYNQRMTPERAAELRQIVSTGLAHVAAQHGPYTATLIHLGQDYLRALSLEQVQAAPFGEVTFTKGGIGVRLGQIKRWLESHHNDQTARGDWVVNVFDDEHDEDRVREAWIISGCTEHEAQKAVEAETDADYTLTPAEPWHVQWADVGDDMACPRCQKRQIETQDRVSCCRACGWQQENPVAF